jgi:hypothetical protein
LTPRLDLNALGEPLCFKHEDSMLELELIIIGGDTATKAERAAMIAGHPDGEPIVTFRHGTRPPSSGQDKPPPGD